MTTFPDPTRYVHLQNQFGEQKLTLARVTFLLVPAHKIEPGLSEPETLDHFKCYKVVEGKDIERKVSLDDQFDSEKVVRVFEPVLFCVPTLKKYGGRIEEIKNSRDHLTIYRIAEKDYSLGRRVQDQFLQEPVQLAITRSVGLAVPSLKLDWS